MSKTTAALLALMSALLVAGCVEDGAVRCADGAVCPLGFRCVEAAAGEPESCQRDERFVACDGLVDGDRCSVPGSFAGSCVDGACTEIRCGNGATQPGEACDDGNVASGDGCNSSCTSDETCGNGIVELAEACDEGEGNADSAEATCLAACTLPRCGDGVRSLGLAEACDDHNRDDGDGCNADCTSNETCGNGYRDPNEACDAGDVNADTPDAPCRLSCQLPRCGDGVVDPGRGETCDDGNNLPGDGCTFACIVESCGNGVVDFFAGEQCDDGEGVNSDEPDAACRPTCLFPRCGDGVHDPLHGEGCDDPSGNSDAPDAACRLDCEPARCGDGVLDGASLGEVCDDGGLASGDGCSGDCRSTEVCGNEYLDAATGEQCDAGAGLSSDGCASSCVVEFDTWQQQQPPNLSFTNPAMAYDVRRAVIVLFGGYQAGVGWTNDTWEYDGAGWVRRELPVRPPARSNAAMAYDRGRQRMVLFGGEVGFDTAADTWEYDGAGWHQVLTPSTPTDRGGAAMAYDDAADRIVMYGGGENIYAQTPVAADTWEYDGTDWVVRVAAASSPPPRRAVSMVFDAQRGVLVLFGGNSGAELNQTWELTGTTWTDRTASLTGSPPAQSGGRLAYDAARQRVVLTGNGSYPTQTWEYAGTGWTSGAGLMASAAWGGLAYDEVRQRLVATGSGVNGGKPQELIAGTWQDRTPAAGPIARGDSAMVFDDRRGHAVLFGGWTNSPPTYFADTWELRNTSWVRRSPPASPPGRYGHMMAYDRARDRVVVFGGFNGAALGDTWEFDGTTWTQRAIPGPPARSHGMMAYDSRHQRVLLYGGSSGGGVRRNDTWVLDGAGWTQLTAAGTPPAMLQTGLVDDVQLGAMVLVGGDNAPTTPWMMIDDTWEVAPSAATPPARVSQIVAYLPERGTVLMAGGSGNALPGGYTGETWEYDGQAWSQRQPVTALPVRAAAAEVYDTAHHRLVAFGGSGGSGYVDELWFYRFANAGAPADACADAAVDFDDDGLAGCDDPDCWSRCTPLCPPGATCDSAWPRCGDGACGAREDHLLCPADCVAP